MDEEQRGIAAIAAIEWFLRDLRERIDELKKEGKDSGDGFEMGLFIGYSEALTMMESRATGLGAIPDVDDDELDGEED